MKNLITLLAAALMAVSAYSQTFTGTQVTTSNLNVTATITASNATFSAPALSTSASASNAPAGNEFPTAQWVRSLLANGVYVYNSSNLAPGTVYGAQPFAYETNIPANFSRTYTAVTNNQYIGAVAITNIPSGTVIQGPVLVNLYLSFNTGGGRSVSVKPEIYYSYDNGTTLYGDWDCEARPITDGTTNLFSYVIDVPATTMTNTASLYRVLKVTAQTANPNLVVAGGSNYQGRLSFSSSAVVGLSGGDIAGNLNVSGTITGAIVTATTVNATTVNATTATYQSLVVTNLTLINGLTGNTFATNLLSGTNAIHSFTNALSLTVAPTNSFYFNHATNGPGFAEYTFLSSPTNWTLLLETNNFVWKSTNGIARTGACFALSVSSNKTAWLSLHAAHGAAKVAFTAVSEPQ